MSARVTKFQDRYAAQLEDISVENCLVGDKGELLYERPPTQNDKGEYKYNKDGMKARNKQRQELFEKDIEIENYITSSMDGAEDLTEIERMHLENFVLPIEVEQQPQQEETTAASVN